MERSVSLPVGIIVAREDSDDPWEDYSWRAVSVMVMPPPMERWKEIRRGPGWVHYLADTVDLELHRKETEAYLANLAEEQPALYVVMREDEDDDGDYSVDVHMVTASPYEAQDYSDSGEDMVDPVAMPDGILAFIKDFINKHHEEEPFIKRKNTKEKLKDHKFGKDPIFLDPRRMNRTPDDE